MNELGFERDEETPHLLIAPQQFPCGPSGASTRKVMVEQ